VTRLREHYERWWAGIEPGLKTFETISVGSAKENPVTLSAMDWLAPKLTPCAQPFDIRQVGTHRGEGRLAAVGPAPTRDERPVEYRGRAGGGLPD